MLKRIVCLCAIVTVFAAFTATADAEPYFKISTLQEWQDALGGGGGGGGGAVVPVPAGDFQAMMNDVGSMWPSNYLDATFCTPELMVAEHTDSHGTTEPALVMQWQDPDGQNDLGQYYAAAWDYVYPEDPDLNPACNNGILEVSIHAPARCWNVSINIIEQDGDYREWIWHVTDPNDPLQPPEEVGEIPACTWTTVQINPTTGWSNYPLVTLFTAFNTDATGVIISDGKFDLTQIARIRFDENGAWTGWFDPKEPGFLPGFQWNAWDHVTYYTPEPGILSVLGLGLIGLARAARRRRT